MRLHFRALFIMAIGVFTVSGLVAQGTSSRPSSVADKYMISAKAGGVNYTEGDVNVVRSDGTSGALVKGDRLEIGDRVSTAGSGRTEILLNPGSYLRVGANSSFEFKTTSLDDLQIKLYGGTAMFEVFATDKFRVNLTTPKEKMWLFDSGVYRVDLQADGSGTIYVTEGKAALGKIGSLQLVTGGKMASFGNGPVTIAKSSFNKKDELAQWSKDRSKTLAKMTASLQNSNARNSLLNSFNSGRWGLYDSFGLWVRDPSGFSCFLPFGRGWYSPYGYGYRTGVYDFVPIYNPPPRQIDPPHDPTQFGGRKFADVGDSPPPFITIDRQQRDAQIRRQRDPGAGFNNDNGRYSSPANGSPSNDSPRSGGGGSPVIVPVQPAPSAPVQPRTDSPARVQSPIDH